MDIKSFILDGKAVLGIELGSTRIKAVLIGADHSPLQWRMWRSRQVSRDVASGRS